MNNLDLLSKNSERRLLNETRIQIRHENDKQVRILRKRYEDGSIVIAHRVEKDQKAPSYTRG